MTLFQIYCVIQLLLAFNVPTQTVVEVQYILDASVASTSPALPTDLPGLSYGAAHYAPAPEFVPVIETNPARVNIGALDRYFTTNKFFKNGLYGDVGIEEWNYVKDAVQVEWLVDGIVTNGRHAPSTGGSKFVLHAGVLTYGEHILTLRAEGSDGVMVEDSVTIVVKNR